MSFRYDRERSRGQSLPARTVRLPEPVALTVVCSECKADMGTRPGFPASLAGAVSHGVCAACLPALRARLTPRCLCGAARAGEWTGRGVHHEAHRCARVVS